MAGPLKSWDIFMMSYDRLMEKAKDIADINSIAEQHQWSNVPDYDKRIKNDTVVVITDTSEHIVYASSNIYLLTGYLPSELIGKKPRMLQGEETDKNISAGIRTAINNTIAFQAEMINYKKDGSKYNCNIEGLPIFNKDNIHTHYIAFEHKAAG